MPRTNTSNLALVLLTDSLYLPGTLRVLESFERQNGPFPAIVLSCCHETLNDPRLKKLTTRQIPIHHEPYESIRPYKKRHSRRHAETFYKFEAFQDFGYAYNLYLDSDLLCLRPVPALLHSSENTLKAIKDTGFRPTRGYRGHRNEINSGVLSIPRSLQGSESVNELRSIATDEPGRGGYNSGDQSVINKWIHRNQFAVDLLPAEYNLIKKDYSDPSGLDHCRLLHFCHRKPWFPGVAPRSELEHLWHEG